MKSVGSVFGAVSHASSSLSRFRGTIATANAYSAGSRGRDDGDGCGGGGGGKTKRASKSRSSIAARAPDTATVVTNRLEPEWRAAVVTKRFETEWRAAELKEGPLPARVESDGRAPLDMRCAETEAYGDVIDRDEREWLQTGSGSGLTYRTDATRIAFSLDHVPDGGGGVVIDKKSVGSVTNRESGDRKIGSDSDRAVLVRKVAHEIQMLRADARVTNKKLVMCGDWSQLSESKLEALRAGGWRFTVPMLRAAASVANAGAVRWMLHRLRVRRRLDSKSIDVVLRSLCAADTSHPDPTDVASILSVCWANDTSLAHLPLAPILANCCRPGGAHALEWLVAALETHTLLPHTLVDPDPALVPAILRYAETRADRDAAHTGVCAADGTGVSRIGARLTAVVVDRLRRRGMSLPPPTPRPRSRL